MSPALRLFVWLMRHLIRPLLARSSDAAAARRGMVLSALGFPAPIGLQWHRSAAMWRVWPRPKASGTVVLYFHGGGYIAGSPWTHRGLLGRIARASGAEVVAPRYPLAPEHPAPAAFDHGLRVFDQLVAEGHLPEQIVLAGDSAGGGLAAALAEELTRRGAGIAGMVLLSPWTDLTLSGTSILEKAEEEALLPPERIAEAVAEMRGRLELNDPRISPLFGSAPNPPPALILVGEAEVLLDDSLRLAEALRARGGRVDLRIEPGAPHVYPFLAPCVPEARRAIARIGRFIRALSPRQPDES